jgi:hypothetical protein
MRRAHLPRSARHALAASVLLALASLAGSSVAAEPGAPPASRPRHYAISVGRPGFVLDPLGSLPKLRFDGSPEIFALTPSRAKEGVVLRRDDGTVLLAVSPKDKVTLFTPEEPEGVEAFLDHQAEPLALNDATQIEAEEGAAFAFYKIKRDYDVALAVKLEAPGTPDTSKTWSAMADAAEVAAIALRDIASIPLGRERLSEKVDRVVIRAGSGQGVEVAQRAVVITVIVSKPIIGRPSSILLESTLADLL